MHFNIHTNMNAKFISEMRNYVGNDVMSIIIKQFLIGKIDYKFKSTKELTDEELIKYKNEILNKKYPYYVESRRKDYVVSIHDIYLLYIKEHLDKYASHVIYRTKNKTMTWKEYDEIFNSPKKQKNKITCLIM